MYSKQSGPKSPSSLDISISFLFTDLLAWIHSYGMAFSILSLPLFKSSSSGNFNIMHHVSWGCNRSDPISNSLFDSSQDSSLFFINDGTPTFISYFSRSSSVIDLTFVSSNLIPYCYWKSVDDTLDSNHIPTVISVSHSIKSCSFFCINFALLKLTANFFSLHSHTSSPLFPLFWQHFSNRKYNTFCNFLKDTIISLLPERKANNSNLRNKIRKKNNDNRGQSFPPAPW